MSKKEKDRLAPTQNTTPKEVVTDTILEMKAIPFFVEPLRKKTGSESGRVIVQPPEDELRADFEDSDDDTINNPADDEDFPGSVDTASEDEFDD